ncbi:MAG: hypothetical protein NW224_10925 [Leptolyngbyaceae cyanobacterium bins.302]|nr:hypothetical protein [Leptolyngbyaceae cyanobacterium bins.302]
MRLSLFVVRVDLLLLNRNVMPQVLGGDATESLSVRVQNWVA